MNVFVCADGASYSFYPYEEGGTNVTVQYGACLSGQGQWVALDSLMPNQEPVMTTTELSPEDVERLKAVAAEGFVAGFSVMGTGLAIVFAVRLLMNFVKSAG